MTSRLALCVAFVVASSAGAAAQPARPMQSEPLVHSFSSVTLSPDGSRIASVDSVDPGPNATRPPTTTIVVRTLSGAGRGSIACPMKTQCRLSSPVWAPEGKRFAYLVAFPRARTAAVWTADADGRNAKPWLTGFKGVIGSPRWAPDGTHLAVLATANALKETGATQAGAALVGDISAVVSNDVQRIAIVNPNGALRFSSPSDVFVYEYDWMPNGRGFVATGATGNGDDNWWIAKLYAIDAATTVGKVIYAPPLQINAPRVSPDGTTVAFISGIMSDFGSVGGDVYTVPVGGGAATDVTPGIAASPNAISWAGHNDRVTFTALAGDANVLETVDVASKKITTLWSGMESVYGDQNLRISLSRDGTTGATTRQTFESAPEIYAGPIGNWHAITNANAAIASSTRAQSVSWTNEGFHVQGWLLAPLKTVPGKKYPMIVEIHGGPSAAAGPRFVGRGTDKELLDRGFYLFYPNPRGSYGQGEAFTQANVRDFGYGDLRDILTGVDAAEKVAPIDDARLAVGGFSYGGYMTMWAVTQTHRFKAAFAGAGIANWQSYYGENGIDKWMLPFFGATVYDDPAVYARSAPITFIKNVQTPTFVFVGERDVECPMPQSLEFWHALTTLGVPTSLVVYEGEGHGIRQPAHTKDINKRIVGWITRYLGT
jgi:dipeptidyl aminopeptidase/acylaminoacyl peptidase